MTSFVNALVVYYYVSRTYCMRAEFVDDVWGIVWSSLSALHKSSHKQFEFFCKMTHKITSNLQSILSQSWIVDHLSLFRRTIACAPVNFLFISTWFVSFVSESIIEFSSFSKRRKVHETAPPTIRNTLALYSLRNTDSKHLVWNLNYLYMATWKEGWSTHATTWSDSCGDLRNDPKSSWRMKLDLSTTNNGLNGTTTGRSPGNPTS